MMRPSRLFFSSWAALAAVTFDTASAGVRGVSTGSGD